MKIGVLRETRRWEDRRVAISPETAELIKKNYPEVELVIQSSNIRVHHDQEYLDLGIPVVADVSDCDVLIGVKEVANEALIEGKTYIMFSHVAKEQKHNQEFLKLMAKKKITLIDFEYFMDKQKKRIVAFGFWAGVVGTYYAFQGIAKRFCGTTLTGPEQCRDLISLQNHLRSFKIPVLKILITGGGRVVSGALNLINELGIPEVLPNDFLNKEYDHPVYTRLDPVNYVTRVNGEYSNEHFYQNPKEYKSSFLPFTKVADVFISCHFWNQDSPDFFTSEDICATDFSISLIADISCDIPGPIPTTTRCSTIKEPFFDIDPVLFDEKKPFSSPNHVTVMTVDNLPAALPVESSRTFSRDLYHEVFPALFGDDKDGVIDRATILRNGKLTPHFKYLSNFLNQHD